MKSMNREFKFRVWDKTNRELLYTPSPRLIAEAYEKILITLDGLVFYYNEKNRLESKDFIIQQFTGFKDANGKDVFEGDIFKSGTYKWDEVKFGNGRFYINLRGARIYDLQELFDQEDYITPIVIGNCFENPELL